MHLPPLLSNRSTTPFCGVVTVEFLAQRQTLDNPHYRSWISNIFQIRVKMCERRGNSPDHPPASGDAGHDDALRSRRGDRLESAPPKLLKELLLLQLIEAAGAALRPQGRRGATGAELERARGLHFVLLRLPPKPQVELQSSLARRSLYSLMG